MQKYNTSLKKITLPEYGRNIENLIKYCKTIPDRHKRTRYAYGIVQFMARVKDETAQKDVIPQVYWDHLALLSNFELDIDYPYEIIKKENLEDKPQPIDKGQNQILFRQYGLVVEKMINQAVKIEEEDKRIRLLELCANQMKLQFHLANKDADENDDKIIHDLTEFVGPQFAEDCYKVYLYSIEELKVNEQYDPTAIVVAPKKKKKRKKKKK